MKRILTALALLLLPAAALAVAPKTKEIGATVSNYVATLTDGSSVAIDGSLASAYQLTMGGNRFIETPSNQVDGQTYVFFWGQDGTGTRVPTFSQGWRFPSGVHPALSTGANMIDVETYVSNGGYMNYISQTKNVDAQPPAAASGVTATYDDTLGSEHCHVTWTDNSTDETEFLVSYCQGSSCDPTLFGGAASCSPVAANAVVCNDTNSVGDGPEDYVFAVLSKRGSTLGTWSSTATCTVPAP